MEDRSTAPGLDTLGAMRSNPAGGDGSDGQPDVDAGQAEGLRVDEVARVAGTTVRNVRAYQDRGLLPPPRRVGRIAWYGPDHVDRLKLIGSLLDRGFTLASIGTLLDAWTQGLDLGQLLGLGAQLVGPYSDEAPDEGPLAEVAERYGLVLDDAEGVGQALAFGLVEVDGDHIRVPSPRLLRAGLELRAVGVPVEVLFDELRRLRADAEAMADRFVPMVVANVLDPHFVDGMPPEGKAPELAAVVQRIRPLATTVVAAELARALQARAEAELGARVTALLAEARGAEPEAPSD